MLRNFLLKQDVVEQLTCTLLPAIIETNWEGCEVFLKTTVSRASDGSKLKHYAIVRSVRQEGKPSHEPVHYLGALTDEEAEGIRNALQPAKNPGSIFVDPSTISAEKHYGFLRLMVLHWIYTSFDLHQLLGRIRYAELLVLNRAVDPKSKAGLFEWACATACPAFLGVPRSADIDFEVYRFGKDAGSHNGTPLLRNSSARGKHLIPGLCTTLPQRTWKAQKCVIAEYGYASGSKRGHKQIKIVLKGTTSDKTTVENTVTEMRELFGIENCTFVVDRGMASFDNFSFIESQGCTRLSALNSNT
jgi:hypothetical protein